MPIYRERYFFFLVRNIIPKDSLRLLPSCAALQFYSGGDRVNQKFFLFIWFQIYQAESQKQQRKKLTQHAGEFAVVFFVAFPLTFPLMRENAESQFDSFPPMSLNVLFVFPLCPEKLSKQKINQRRLKASGMYSAEHTLEQLWFYCPFPNSNSKPIMNLKCK